MNAPLLPVKISAFMASHLPDFLDHFEISFCVDGPQVEYFVSQKTSGLDISCSLTVSLDEATGQVHVMTFYPGLWQHPETRYFSAVCFFMVLNHFANRHHIVGDCHIHLNTRTGVFDDFYALLKDFDFHVQSRGADDHIAIESCFFPLGLDTSMCLERALS